VTQPLSIVDLLRPHIGSDRPGLAFEGQRWTYGEYVQAAADRAAWILDIRNPGPLHVGVLLDNVPEFSFFLAACALAGATLVGINPTRQGEELARDINFTDCQVIVTESRHAPLLEGLRLDCGADRVFDVDAPGWVETVGMYRDSPFPELDVPPLTQFLLLFTSGTTGAPKAVIASQARTLRSGSVLAERNGLTADDVCYQAMPMFHSNALFAGWTPALVAGATHVLRRRFSASNFLADVRAYGCTYFNYVGKPLSYVLAQPERPDDADNPLRIVFGNEGADHDLERFAARFGCEVVDSYGSTEAGATVGRRADMPKGSLGKGPEGTCVVNPETGLDCPPAEFDEHGRLRNPDEAIGEIVNKNIGSSFEGYYKNPEANEARMRNGWYWSGDLAYMDADGWIYFAGRDSEWLRVDGENFAAAPVERIIARHPDVQLVAVYAVPDEEVGDQLMACLQVADPAGFDAASFDAFLDEQTDLGTKWSPRYVRLTAELPMGHSNKVQKRQLRHEKWESPDPTLWRPRKGEPLRRITDDDRALLRAEFEARGRLRELDVL
jgi:fatty-acyl-CoA synthase